MSLITLTWLLMLIGGFAVALALEFLTLRLARRWTLYAQPNERSSHRVPTPSIGGLAFVVPVLGYLLWVAAAGERLALALAASGALLAAIGLWDDLREVSARMRLASHVLAAALVLFVILPNGGWLLTGLLTIALVWQINLYNFMDGIDGLAGVQCLVFCVGAQLLGQGVAGWPGDLLWLVAGATMGFLVFNAPPARIFMGDTGSGFLGLLTGALTIILWLQEALPLSAAFILLAGFWFDATYTLIVRVGTGQPFTQAHRSHLYQKLAVKRGHLWTTGIYLAFAIVWLLPLAWFSTRLPPLAVVGSGAAWAMPAVVQHVAVVLLAVTPLAVAARRFGAGRTDLHEVAQDL